jgi:hypothetical protein
MLGRGKNPTYQGLASQYVYLVTTHAASLEAALKRCGLEGVKPSIYNRDSYRRIARETSQALMRVALLHPFNSAALLDSLDMPSSASFNSDALLPSLREPKRRAKISPEMFITWNRHLRFVPPRAS